MTTPRNYHEFPKPDTESANNPEYTGELSIQNIAKLVRPKGASLEQPVATVSRVAHRVFNRRNGKMQSADEFAEKNFLAVDKFSVTSVPSVFPDGTSYMPIENGADWGLSQGGAVLVTHRQPDGDNAFISAIQTIHHPDRGELAERVSKDAGTAWTDWVFPLETEEPTIPLSSFPDSTPFDFIGFYEDFTIRPDGQSVGNGITAPIVGGDPYQESYNGPPPAPSGGSFVTEGGGFRVPVLSNNYLGSSIYTPNGVLDVTFDLLSVNPANEVNTTAFTFTFKDTPVVNGIGPSPASSTIAPSAGIHINFDSNGSIIATHFQQSTPVTILSQGENSYQWPMRTLFGNSGSLDGGNTRWRVNMRAYGDRLEVTSRGRTIVIQCAAIAENIGAEKTYFYFQTNRTEIPGLPPAAVRNYTKLERMWANAPALSLRAAVGGSYGSVFDGHPHARYPNKIDVRPGNLPLIGNGSNQARIFTRSLFIGGAKSINNVFGRPAYQNGGFYVEGKSFHSNLTTNGQPVTFALSLVGAFTNPVASPANASITSPALLGLGDGSGFIGPSPGATVVDDLCGTFGANDNPKRIQIRDNTLVFDSGEITQNGGAWRMTIRRSTLTAVSNNYFVEFWSQATGILFVNVPRIIGGGNLPINLFASGVAAGDVTIGFRRAIATQDNN